MQLTSAVHIQSQFHFDPAELRVVSSRDIPTEHEEQRAFISWWRKSFDGVWIYAVPNGGGRGIREAGRLKAEGVSAGVPDLVAPALALYIEFKKQKGGSVSKEQKAWHAHLRACGYIVIIPKGAAQAVELVISHIASMIPARDTQTIDWIDN